MSAPRVTVAELVEAHRRAFAQIGEAFGALARAAQAAAAPLREAAFRSYAARSGERVCSASHEYLAARPCPWCGAQR